MIRMPHLAEEIAVVTVEMDTQKFSQVMAAQKPKSQSRKTVLRYLCNLIFSPYERYPKNFNLYQRNLPTRSHTESTTDLLLESKPNYSLRESCLSHFLRPGKTPYRHQVRYRSSHLATVALNLISRPLIFIFLILKH